MRSPYYICSLGGVLGGRCTELCLAHHDVVLGRHIVVLVSTLVSAAGFLTSPMQDASCASSTLLSPPRSRTVISRVASGKSHKSARVIGYDKRHDTLYFRFKANAYGDMNDMGSLSTTVRRFDGDFATLLHIMHLLRLRCEAGASRHELMKYRQKLLQSGLDDSDLAQNVELRENTADSVVEVLNNSGVASYPRPGRPNNVARSRKGPDQVAVRVMHLLRLWCNIGDRVELMQLRQKLLQSGLDDNDTVQIVELREDIANIVVELLNNLGGASYVRPGRPKKAARPWKRPGRVAVRGVSRSPKAPRQGSVSRLGRSPKRAIDRAAQSERRRKEAQRRSRQAAKRNRHTTVSDEFELPRPVIADKAIGICSSHVLTHKRGMVVCTRCARWSIGSKLRGLRKPCDPESLKEGGCRVLWRWLTGSGDGRPQPNRDWTKPPLSEIPDGFRQPK